jgi:hypothetical protein
MLEIGVQNGGGLEIWAKYFQKGAIFIGCDVNPDCAALQFDDPRIKLVIGNANSDQTQKEILSHSPELDIVIEDGSHFSSDVIASFLRYFPNLVDGGIYVAEDLHTSYWENYEGGLFAPLSSISFFKRLVDIINSEHWGVERNRSEILAGFREKYEVEVKPEILDHIHSIKFVNSLCIILKSPPPENRLGTRFIAGSTAAVSTKMQQFHGSFLTPEPQGSNPWTTRIRPPDEELPELEKQVEMLEMQVQTLNENILDLREKVNEAEQEVQSLNVELGEIYRSRGWKFLQNIWRLRLWLIPHGSAREQMARALFHPVGYWRRHGFKSLVKRIYKNGTVSKIPVNTPSYRALKPQHVDIPEEETLKTGKHESCQQSLFRPLPVFLSPFSRQRLNILISEINSDQPFGPEATDLIFSTLLAEKWDCELRLVTHKESADKQFFSNVLHYNNIPINRNVEFLTINEDISKTELPIGQEDIFITTSWDTTASLLNVIDEDRIIYLLQKDERISPPLNNGNDDCLKVLHNKRIKFVVNTKALFEHFASAGFESIRSNGTWFEPAWPETLFFSEGVRPDGRKNFFYTNSSDFDDLLCMGFDAIEGAFQKGIINQDEWNFYSVSKFGQKTRNSQTFLLKRYQDIDWAEYLSLARKTDLGLVLTGTPFLLAAYHPLDLIASGSVVVSDFPRDAQDLITSPKNMIYCKAQIDEIIQGLARGVELVNNADLRLSNFNENMFPKDWRISFKDVMSVIERWGFNVPA